MTLFLVAQVSVQLGQGSCDLQSNMWIVVFVYMFIATQKIIFKVSITRTVVSLMIRSVFSDNNN